MKHLLYLLTLLSFLFTGCGNRKAAESKVFWMDNPTSASITVGIDDQIYELPATSGIDVELNFGKHSMTYSGETIQFVVKPNDQQCVINPTLSNYVFYTELYVVEGQEDRAEAEYEKVKSAYLNDFVFNGDTVQVPFKVIKNKLFIEQYEYYWHFGVTEPYRDVRLNMGRDPSATVDRSKLFREKDFLEYIGKENLPKGFVIEPPTMRLKDLPAYEYVLDSVIEGCPAEREALQKLKAKFDSLQVITDPVRFQYLTWYGLEQNMLEINGRVRGHLDDTTSNCTRLFIDMVDRKPPLGEMNAYIVK